VVVSCPKSKIKLKVADEKLTIENFIENKKKNHKNLKKTENTRKNPIKRDFKP